LPDDLRALVQQCLAEDQSAMMELVDRFRSQVFGLCLRMLGNRQDAEDVMQEVFLRVFRSLRRFDINREFRPWLLAIAGNRCRTLLATRSRRPQPVTLIEDSLPDGSPDWEAERHFREEVDLALGKLREEYRQAFLLFHEQEFSYAEISAALACPVGTVKTWIHRARGELARELRRRGVVEEPDHELRNVRSTTE